MRIVLSSGKSTDAAECWETGRDGKKGNELRPQRPKKSEGARSPTEGRWALRGGRGGIDRVPRVLRAPYSAA